MSCNVRGLADVVKRKAVFQFLYSRGVDIALLQEIHSSKNKERIWRSQWGDL